MKKSLKFLCAILALFFVSFNAHAATLNFRYNGTTKQIELDTTKRTAPALAMRVGDTVYYANLVEMTTCASGNACISYGNKTYKIHDNSKYKFTITTTNMNAGTNFGFQMSAAGKFTVDWGDGNVEEIVRTDTTNATYSHTYNTAGVRTIKMGGTATQYSTRDTTAAISFYKSAYDCKIAAISGSLGAIFPTLGTVNGKQPGFYRTFLNCFNLTELPPGLFANISGSAENMFISTFAGCIGLTKLPEDLFANISGSASYMFAGTFSNCSGLKELPSGLFAKVSGAAEGMFNGTFSNCSGLKELPPGLFANVSGSKMNMFQYTFSDCTGLTSLPSGLFANISGSAAFMFWRTFDGCSGLTSLPPGLFANISGSAYYMFAGTFDGCSSLTGESAKIGDKYLYQIYDDDVGEQCYSGATGLSDYDDIPSGWK